jgi:tetratricopeptide (TPR) repeat protein
MTMSALEALDELANYVSDVYEEAVAAEGRRSLSVASSEASVRDAMNQPDAVGKVTTKADMLGAWQNLIRTLFDAHVYHQYVPSLERLFEQVTLFDESLYSPTRILVELMIQSIEHADDQKESAECRYVTLMEILSSFVEPWKLSPPCKRIWNQNFGSSKSSQDFGTPETFRRTAYENLTSLSWVPNSPGLKALCFDGQIEASIPCCEEEIPPVVRSIFCQIRSMPLPRHECIHQLLHRLLPAQSGANNSGDDEGNVSVAIAASWDDNFSSRAEGTGLGKTTLAAMVIAHPSVRAKFTVLWLRFDQKTVSSSMTYEQYVHYLTDLCEQLGVEPNWPQPVQSLEENALRKKRQEELMFQVKREMSRILEMSVANNHDHKLLMVMDNVIDDQEIEWFLFLPNQSLLVTTLAESLSVDWTLEVESLSEEEALELFLTEADFPPSHVISTSLEAKSIVHRCGYHPLTIRTVARWFRLKQVTAGVVKGLEELNQELSSCIAKLRHSRSKAISPSKILGEVMNLMLSPVLTAGGQPTILMKLCLSSMAVVFFNKVPTEAVHLLWGQLLRTEADAIRELGDSLTPNQLKKRVRFISEALSSLGLLSMTEKNEISYVEIHHEMQVDYAIDLCREMQYGNTDAIRQWHGAFATAYLTKKVESDRDGLEDKCRSYALEKLLYHMLKAGMLQKVAVLLRDERFLRERLDNMGWNCGIKTHIEDCQRLRQAMKDDESLEADPNDIAGIILTKVGSFLADYADAAPGFSEAAVAIHLIGFALAEMGHFSDAVSQYKSALQMAPKGSPLAGTILFAMSTAYVARKDYDRGLKNIKECLKIMSECGETNVLYSEALMLKADALTNNCDYRGAMDFYDLALEKCFTNSANNRVEIGIALGKKGRLYHIMGQLDNALETYSECIKWKENIDEVSGDIASIYNFMGDISLERGEKKKALLYFDRAYRTFELLGAEADETEVHVIDGKTDDLNGDFDGCRENFELAIDNIRNSRQASMERNAYDLRVMARTLMANNDDSRAIQILNQCLKLTNEKAEDSLERAAALEDMGTLHLEMDNAELALQCLQESLKIRIQKLGESPIVISTLLKIGHLHRSNGQLEEAFSFVNKALDVTERVYGESDERVSDVLYEVADIKLSMNENVEALAMFGECLDFRRKQHGRGHPQIAQALEGLSRVHLKNGTYDKSYQCLVEALDMRQATMEPDHPDIATTFHLIGMVARKGGDCERALHFLLDALHIRKRLKDQADTVLTLTEIGHVHRQLHDETSALGCYEKSVEIVIENYGDADTRLIDVYLPLGHVKKRQKVLDEAKEYYESALRIARQQLGEDHVKVGAALRSLGLLQFDSQKYDEAIEYLEAFVKIQEANKTKKQADYILALQLIGDIHRHNSNSDAASSAFATANNVFSSSKEVAKKYPGFAAILQRRIASVENDMAPPPPSGLFARITGELGRLADETKAKESLIQVEEDEVELRNSMFFDD